MNHQTKMIIITSDEDLIQRISFNRSNNTQIIDLDQNKTLIPTSMENNNLLDFNFLAQLSELNPHNDQIYKRVLDSPPRRNRSKMLKTSKKGNDLVCIICGDHAIGFNYDVLTCSSCKAFFRRNAQYQPEKLRCLTGDKKCSVSHEVSRKCQRCRLERCLNAGMRRDFILTEEEKQKRRERLEANRQMSSTQIPSQSSEEIDQFLMDTNNDLNIEDWLDIQNVRQSYSSIFLHENSYSYSYETSDRISALITWSELVSGRVLQLIHFFQQIDQFENLNSNDQFILIKYNLLPLVLIQRTLQFNPSTGNFLDVKKEEAIKRRQFFTLCYGTSGLRDTFFQTMSSLATITERDQTLVELLLLVLLFSKGLSISENEPFLNDELSVYRAQCHYTRLLWTYLVSKQGEEKSLKQFLQILTEISRIQSFSKAFRTFFQTKIESTNILEKVAPLMQAFLNVA